MSKLYSVTGRESNVRLSGSTGQELEEIEQ